MTVTYLKRARRTFRAKQSTLAGVPMETGQQHPRKVNQEGPFLADVFAKFSP